MTAVNLVLVVMFVGISAYALFGGADFGAGVWDLLAGGAKRGARSRALIEHVIGPVWEANHVWLVFVLVIMWSCFPRAFGPIMSTLFIPATLAAIGIIARGSAFAFRKAVNTMEQQRVFGAVFALASLMTPFFLGALVGGVASGRVPASGTGGDIWESWLNPTGILGGVLAVLVCTYLAAVYLCRDAQRRGEDDLARGFRWRAIVSGAITGTVALIGIQVLHADAKRLYDGLTHEALWLVLLSAAAGFVSFVLLWTRHYIAVRISAAVAVVSVIWGWAVAQYPYMIEDQLTIKQAAGDIDTIRAVLGSLIVGSVVIVPALAYLAMLLQRGALEGPATEDDELVV